MVRLAVFVVLLVAAVVAYPWAALAVVVVGAGGLWLASRRRATPATRAGAAVQHVSLERRVALRRARDELREIERGAGL